MHQSTMHMPKKWRFSPEALKLIVVALLLFSPSHCVSDNVSLSIEENIIDTSEISCNGDIDSCIQNDDNDLAAPRYSGKENGEDTAESSKTAGGEHYDGDGCEDDVKMDCKAKLLEDEASCKEENMMQKCRLSCGVCDAEKASEAYGVRQSISGSLSNEMMDHFQKTEEYMNNIQAKKLNPEMKLHDDDNSQNNTQKSEPCLNYFSDCLLWAVEGYCDSPYRDELDEMIAECSPECRTCHLEASECAQLRRDRVPSLLPGDLYRMFERLAAAAATISDDNEEDTQMSKSDFDQEEQEHIEWLKQFQPKVLSSPQHKSILDRSYKDGNNDSDNDHGDSSDDDDDGDNEEHYIPPWVITLDRFLTPEEAQHFINIGYRRGFKQSYYELDKSKNKDDQYDDDGSKSRTSQNTWCKFNYDAITQSITQRIENITGISHRYAEPYQLLKYEEGELYEEHHDYSDSQVKSFTGARILTVFLYLNDVEEGGGTRFGGLNNLTVTPQLGKALIWPSVLNNEPDERDDWTLHEALPVIKGKKFGSNVWYHLYDFHTNHKCDL